MPRFNIPARTFSFGLSILITSLTTLLLWYAFRPGRPDPASTRLLQDLANLDKVEDEDDLKQTTDQGECDADDATDVTRKTTNTNPLPKHSDLEQAPLQTNNHSDATTPLTSNVRYPAEKEENTNKNGNGVKKSDFTTSAASRLASIHAQIEEIDKKGKLLFKNKQYFEAAEAFTEALNLIETKKKSEVDKDSVTSSSLNRQLVTLLNNRSAMYEKADLPDLALIGM
jgi:tetratricopeptide (TPR) repeat protein